MEPHETDSDRDPAPNLRPSAAYRWMYCTASPWLEHRLKLPEKSSSYAEEGTRLHGVIAKVLDHDYFQCPEEDMAVISKALKMTQEIRDKYQWSPAHIEMTHEIVVEGMTIRGTPDYFVIKNGSLLIIDWKFGAGVPVPAEGNRQMMLYAAMIIMTTGTAVREVKIVIAQPRVPGGLSVKTYARSEIEDFVANKVKPVVKLILMRREVRYVPGVWTCRFCPVKEYCAAFGAFLRDNIEPGLMPKEDLAATLDACNAAQGVRYEVEARALKLMQGGGDVPGLCITQSRAGIRRWRDEKEVMQFITNEKPELYDDMFDAPKVKSPSKLSSTQRELYQALDGKGFIEQAEPHDKVSFDPDYVSKYAAASAAAAKKALFAADAPGEPT